MTRDELIHEAQNLDSQEDLTRFRELFYIPEGRIYMDGNSLGLLSRPAEARILKAIDEWKEHGIEGWLDADPPWFFMPERLAKLSAPLIGAQPEEVIIANSTSVNLHQVLATFYKPQGQRTKIIIDAFAFPTDAYVVQSQIRLRGLDPNAHLVTVAPRGRLLEEDDFIAAIDVHRDQVAMLVLPGVVYTTGQLLNIEHLTREAQKRGALICIDAAHSMGSVPHHFDEWGVDFAIWCNYKYLNGGPGAAGGMYVNQRHWGTAPGLAGWFSSNKDNQFDMLHQPIFSETAGAYQIGTPPLMAMAALEASLEMFAEAGIVPLRDRSLRLTRYLIELVDRELSHLGYSIPTPRDDLRRGGHVSVAHAEATRINRALKAANVIPDFRPPDMIRLAPVALYNTFEDVARTIITLKHIVESGEYLKYAKQRGLVA